MKRVYIFWTLPKFSLTGEGPRFRYELRHFANAKLPFCQASDTGASLNFTDKNRHPKKTLRLYFNQALMQEYRKWWAYQPKRDHKLKEISDRQLMDEMRGLPELLELLRSLSSSRLSVRKLVLTLSSVDPLRKWHYLKHCWDARIPLPERSKLRS